MKLTKRWKAGLLITGYVLLIGVMVRYAYPNSFRRASDYNRYQQDLTRSMAERNAPAELLDDAAGTPAAHPDEAVPPRD